MNSMTIQKKTLLTDVLIPWEYQVSAGYTVSGLHSKPSGKPVIHFVHGNGYCGLVYQQLLLKLSKHYDLFLSDIQSHGNSELGGYFRGWNENAMSCLEVWRHFGKAWAKVPRIAMGHSLGGVLSVLMMAEDVLAFDKAILLDPVLFSPVQLGMMSLGKPLGLLKKTQLASRTRRRQDVWPNKHEAYDYFFQRGMFRGWNNDCLWDYVNYAMKSGMYKKNWQLKCPPQIEADIFASYPKHLWRSLNRVKNPTWILYGDNSYPMVEKSARLLSKKHSHYSCQSFPGKHCFMQEKPVEVAKIVHSLLK